MELVQHAMDGIKTLEQRRSINILLHSGSIRNNLDSHWPVYTGCGVSILHHHGPAIVAIHRISSATL